MIKCGVADVFMWEQARIDYMKDSIFQRFRCMFIENESIWLRQSRDIAKK